MKIAITGSSGFIGKNLVSELLALGNMDFIPLTRNKNSEFYTDYSLESLKKWFKDIDAVVHLAAKRGSGGSFSDYEENIILSENIARACKECSVSKLIYISSISVYSNQNELPWAEEPNTETENYYGLSKLISEEISRINLKNSKTKLLILRLAHVYGANEQNNYMINLFMRKAFNKKTILVTEVNGNRREFIYVKDVVKAILLACTYNQKKEHSVFNIGTNDVLTNQEVAKIVTQSFESENLIIEPQKYEFVNKNSYMSHEKAKELLNYAPVYNMETAMKEIYSIMKDGGEIVPILY